MVTEKHPVVKGDKGVQGHRLYEELVEEDVRCEEVDVDDTEYRTISPLRPQTIARRLGRRRCCVAPVDRAAESPARQPAAGTAVEAAGGPPAERRMLSDNVRRQRVRQGLGVERAGGAAGLQLREER